MKKLTILFTLMLLMLVTAIPTFAEEPTEEGSLPSLDGIIEYDGLSARSVQDYAGLRSTYTVNEDKVAALEKQGYKVLYGALMGVGDYKQNGESKTGVTVDQMTVALEDGKVVAYGNGTKGYAVSAVLVYATDSIYQPSRLYTSRETNEAGERIATFAYTTTYSYTSRGSKNFKDTELVYRAFILLVDGSGTAVATHYENATGTIFGNATGSYGISTSLYEVCKHFTTDAALKEEWGANLALLSVIEDCQNNSFTKVYAADPNTDDTGVVELTAGVTLALPDMQAGLYKLTLTGKTLVTTGAQVTVEATVADAHFKLRTKKAYSTYQAFDTVYVLLPAGSSTVTLSGSGTADKNKLNIAAITLTQVSDENTGNILFTPYSDMTAVAKEMGLTKAEQLAFRYDSTNKVYYKTNGDDYMRSCLTDVAYTELPETYRYNCIVNIGTATSGTSYIAGFKYHTEYRGLTFNGNGGEVRFTIHAEKEGVYTVYLPYYGAAQNLTVTNITPNITAPNGANSTQTNALSASSSDNSTSADSYSTASDYTTFEIYLKQGDNNIHLQAEKSFTFTQIAFSPKPDYDTVTFKNANGETVSVQKAYTVDDLKVPTAKIAACKGKEFVEFDMSLYVQGSDAVITAEEYDLHTVTFMDGTTVLKTVEVKDYDNGAVVPAAKIPYMPKRDESLFTGWSGGDVDCITGDVTLTAVYTEIVTSPTPYDYAVNGGTVIEAAEDGSTLKSYTINAGGSATENYLQFNVNASVAGFYKFRLQLEKKADVNAVKIYNTQLAYYGAGQVDNGNTYDTSPANFGVPVDNGYTYIGSQYLLRGENTIRIFVQKSSIAVSDVTVELGAALTDSDVLLYAQDAVKVTNIEDDSNTGGIRVETGANTAQLRYNGVSLASGYYSFAGLMAYNNKTAEMKITFTHKTDPSLSTEWSFYPGVGRINGYGSSTELLQYAEEPVMLIAGDYDIVIDLPASTNMRYTMLALRLVEPIAGVLETVPAGSGILTNATLDDQGAVSLTGTADSNVSFTVEREEAGFLRLSVVGTATEGTTLYCDVNGKIYTLSVAEATESAALDAKPVVYLQKGKNAVTFFCKENDSFALRAFSGIPADGTLESSTDAIAKGSLTSGKANLESKSNKTYDEAVYKFDVSESGDYALRLRGDVTHGAVLFYQLRDSENNVLDPITGEILKTDDPRLTDLDDEVTITVDDYFVAYTAHYATTETVMDILPILQSGKYTVTLRLYRSPDYEKKEGVPTTVEASVSELALVGVGLVMTAPAETPIDSVTGACTLNMGDSLTYTVSLTENAVYLARLFGRADAGTTFTVTAEGQGNIDAGDYYNRMLYKAVSKDSVTAQNVTDYYTYNVITGVYDKATAYDENTVYYTKTGSYENTGDSFTFTVEGGSLADGFMTLDRLNLLSDQYDITVSVTAGSLSITELTLIREADYIRVIEIPNVADNKVVIASDNHYVRKNDAENQTILANSIVKEGAGAAFFDGDFTTTRLDASDTIGNGRAYYYAMSYEVNTLFAPLRENNIPMFVLHADHDHKSSEEWYSLFGYEKNYMVQMGTTLYICLDNNYLQSDWFAYGEDGTVADISDAFCEAVLERLDSADVKQAVIVRHYNTLTDLPKIQSIWAHDKIMVTYGGHTHYNINLPRTNAGSLNRDEGVDFAQTGHFAHVGSEKGYGQTQNPFVPIMHISSDAGYYMTFVSVTLNENPVGSFASLGDEYKNKNYGDAKNLEGTWYTYAYTSAGEKIIALRSELVNLQSTTDINLYLVKDGNYYRITAFGDLAATPYAGSKVTSWESSGNPRGYRILQTNTDGAVTYFETYMTYAEYSYDGFEQAHIHVRPDEMFGFVDRTYMRLRDVTD